MSVPKRSPAAFGTSLRARLKTEASRRGRPINELEREFVLQRFLARVFAARGSPWVLKGGGGLLVRLPGARYSQDLRRFIVQGLQDHCPLPAEPGYGRADTAEAILVRSGAC